MQFYFDCNATTPLDPEVREVMLHYLLEEYGNEGSRTHEFGSRAKRAVQKARDQVGEVCGVTRDSVIFTSGATESNNLAILGLETAAKERGAKHLITTQIEHKAVLEPMQHLATKGFDVTYLPCGADGRINPAEVLQALRSDTFLVSIMASNNETGIKQPMAEICELMKDHPAYLHSDAAQSFGKDVETLQLPRIDLISISGHKIYAPKGVGALITRKRGYDRPPITPLMHGGGQERGLRPGTLPVALIAALGKAAESAQKNLTKRRDVCGKIRGELLEMLQEFQPRIHGDPAHCMNHVLNFAIPGIDSEALIVILKDLVAFSNGSACTSSAYVPSHVIKALGYTDDQANEAVRMSWCHLTPEFDWKLVAARLKTLL